jgi:hypothetical protein
MRTSPCAFDLKVKTESGNESPNATNHQTQRITVTHTGTSFVAFLLFVAFFSFVAIVLRGFRIDVCAAVAAVSERAEMVDGLNQDRA